MTAALDYNLPVEPAPRGDRCPHRRPFPAGFAGCPAFQPVGFVAADSMEQPFGEAVSCRHLGVGEDAVGRFYARCALGRPAARLAWVTEVGTVRLDVVRSLEEEFATFSAPFRAALVAARTAAQRTPWNEHRRRELDALVADYLSRTSAFLEERSERLEDAGIPLRPMLELASRWWLAWARRPGTTEPVLADDPDPADTGPAWLGMPATTAGRGRRRRSRNGRLGEATVTVVPPPAVTPGDESVLLDADRLRVVRRRHPDDRLLVTGEIDAGNADVLVATVAGTGTGDDLHLDLGGVLFLGLSGVRALVGIASRLPQGRTLVLHRPPPEARRVMQLIGWPQRVDLGLDGTPVRLGASLDIRPVSA